MPGTAGVQVSHVFCHYELTIAVEEDICANKEGIGSLESTVWAQRERSFLPEEMRSRKAS